MNIKKIVFAVIAVIVFQVFYSNAVFAAETDSRIIRVGVYDNSPKIYRDSNGEIKGFWADITNYIAKKENWNLVYVYGTWEEGLARLEKGEIDLMVDVAVSEARKEKYDFNTESALLSWSIIYTRKDFDVKSFKDLEGKNIAIMKSSVHYTAPLGLKNVLTSFGVTANIIDAKSMDEVFKLLDTDQADAGVVNWNFGVSNENKYKINRTGIIFNPSELNYALPKNGSKNSYLVNVLDYHLRELKNNPDSIYYQSINTNFAKSLGTLEVLPKWLNTFLIVAGVLLLIILAIFLLMRQYQKTLKKEIDNRIRDIKESEEKYSAVVSQAQDGIVIVQDQVIKYANKAINIIGYSDTEVLGMPFIKMIAPDEQKKVAESYKKRVAGQKVEAIYETKLAHKDGTTIDVEFSSGIIKYKNQPAVLVMVRDITERKKMETKLKELDALKSKFIEIVAHQLHTPLNVIRWSLESILSNTRFKLDEAIKEPIYNSLNANVEVINRIDDLLRALDIEEGRLAHLNKKQVSLESLWESVMIEAKKRCVIKKIDCFYQAPPESLSLMDVDSDKIRSIFEKLIDNAIYYTKEGGKITVLLKQNKGKIRFEVADNGIGIPKAEQKNIFLRFYRATNATPMRPDASGLGLFIAKYFAEQHGGKIGFKSVEGQGSTFWFELDAPG